jgi:hypothetical protein
MRIKKTKFFAGIAVATLLLLATVGIVAAGAVNTVVILTPPLKLDAPVYWDADGDGMDEPNEYVGLFPSYNGNNPMQFSWVGDPYEVSDLAHTAYRVSLIQWYPTAAEIAANGGTVPDWRTWTHFTQTKVAHHFATDPNGHMFTMGSFGFGEPICRTCPSMFVVMPESFAKYYDTLTLAYEYEYALLGIPTLTKYWSAAGLAEVPAGSTQISNAFVLEIYRYSPPEPEPDKDKSCEPSDVLGECSCDPQTDDLICLNSCGDEVNLGPNEQCIDIPQ